MAFTRFRPTSHFIAPHSWMNDPCGAIYIPETGEHIICYQWNPGTAYGGNCAWGMARSKDLVQWKDCQTALRNGTSYDCLGVFSGSIVSRVIDGRRVLFLFYRSISALPIHVSIFPDLVSISFANSFLPTVVQDVH
jgi:beta-fructofuranosidase